MEVELEKQTIVEEEKIGTEKTIQINGEMLTLPYEKSVYSPFFNDDVDYYGAGNVSPVSFGINQTTGKCTSYYRLSRSGTSKSSLPVKSRQECIKIAEAFFKQFADDSDSYELHDEVYYDWMETPEYIFTFTRKRGDIFTAEFIDIQITCTGSIQSYHATMLNIMKNINPPDKETVQHAQSLAEQRIDEIFASTNYTFNYSKPVPTLTKMKSGQLALYYSVDVHVTVFGGSIAHTEIVELLIYL